mmetsp:Transcript_830/g.3439  ORF Transcript_830/g.3439 Transcript_830/m.3439 type:complete len:113 (+) Transcript_830:499-837(+)
MIVNENQEVLGILSQRDYVRKVALLGKSSKATPTKDIMTTRANLLAAKQGDSLQKCMRLMLARDVRHLPVIADDEKLTGLLSIKDLIKCSMEQKDSMIKGLSKKALGSLNPE